MPDSLTTDPASSAPKRRAAPPVDGPLFADGPARDGRYRVVDHWRDCTNLPGDHPLHQVEFIHRQMNEEINAVECSARNLTDFPDAPWELRMWLARQCADEARHGHMFRRRLESLGGHVGQFPVMNFQYRIITNADTLVGRLAIQNRTFEAGGIDAVSWAVEQAQKDGDGSLAEFFESQLADEIVHVRFANDWLRGMIRANPRELLSIGRAMVKAAAGFKEVMGSEGTEGIYYPTDRAGRAEAGFTEEEVALDAELSLRNAPKDQRVHTVP